MDEPIRAQDIAKANQEKSYSKVAKLQHEQKLLMKYMKITYNSDVSTTDIKEKANCWKYYLEEFSDFRIRRRELNKNIVGQYKVEYNFTEKKYFANKLFAILQHILIYDKFSIQLPLFLNSSSSGLIPYRSDDMCKDYEVLINDEIFMKKVLSNVLGVETNSEEARTIIDNIFKMEFEMFPENVFESRVENVDSSALTANSSTEVSVPPLTSMQYQMPATIFGGSERQKLLGETQHSTASTEAENANAPDCCTYTVF